MEQPPSTDGGDSDVDSLDHEDLSHMETVESVINEIGICHPIAYDIYDLCEYNRKAKLNSFTVSMLKEICLSFELLFKSRDTKAVLVSKVKQMTSEFPCSTEDLILICINT